MELINSEVEDNWENVGESNDNKNEKTSSYKVNFILFGKVICIYSTFDITYPMMTSKKSIGYLLSFVSHFKFDTLPDIPKL